MIDVEAFRRSLADPSPPGQLDLALQALWWVGKGDWDRAHGCAQHPAADRACDLAHAHLHRVEGDMSNASYWYGRAGRATATMPLDQEWAALVAELLARADGAVKT